jgi:hypothetical protein
MIEKGRAVTENPKAPCIVRTLAPITILDAHMLLTTCGIGAITVMQYGQKSDFANKLLHWVLKNVHRGGGCATSASHKPFVDTP